MLCSCSAIVLYVVFQYCLLSHFCSQRQRFDKSEAILFDSILVTRWPHGGITSRLFPPRVSLRVDHSWKQERADWYALDKLVTAYWPMNWRACTLILGQKVDNGTPLRCLNCVCNPLWLNCSSELCPWLKDIQSCFTF